jgi:hypothetical protein
MPFTIIQHLMATVDVSSRDGIVVVVIVWWLDLQLSMQSLPITTNVVSSNPLQAMCTRYNIV